MPQEKFQNALPVDWDGRFPFTNVSQEDFYFTWAKKQYLFPANKTIDMMKMGMNQTPVEVQQIRKFAAKQFAEREFFKGDSAKKMESIEKDTDGNSRLMNFQAARTYSDSDLRDLIQQCLTPLPEGKILAAEVMLRDTESEIHKDDETGQPVSSPVKNSSKSLDPGGILVN